MTKQERLNLILGNLQVRSENNENGLYMSEEALLELSEIMGTQDEAILEVGELLSQLIAGGEDNGSILSETN